MLDILVAAIGRPGFVTPEMVKPGATVIDVGMNRVTSREDFDRFSVEMPAAKKVLQRKAPLL